MSARPTTHRLVHRVARHVVFILAFSVPSVILWWHVWSRGPASTVSCPCWDSGQEVWFISWPAFALRHGILPFFSHALWSPAGVNLLNNTSAPLTGIVLSPVTWFFGPVVSNNVALTLAPGLSAWSCWLACCRFVRWSPAAVFGGLLFGYSPFVVSSIADGHLSIALLVVPPLVVVLLHEICVRQEMRIRVAGLLLGLLVAAQFLISVEVLALMGIAAGAAVVAAAVGSPKRARATLPYASRAFATAALVAAVLLAWPAWFFLAGPRHIAGVPFSIDAIANGRLFHLWNPGPGYGVYWIPGSTTAIGIGVPVDYVGFGVVVLAIASLVVARRLLISWVLIAVAVVCMVLSWGSSIWVSQTHKIAAGWLPWQLIAKVPVLRDILPVRFAIFVDLACALLIAIGVDTVSRRAPFNTTGRTETATEASAAGPPGTQVGQGRTTLAFKVLFAGAVALAVIPQWLTYQVPIATQRVTLPHWFATAGRTIAPGSTVLTYPFPISAAVVAQPLVWQAVDGMRFNLVGGYVKVPGRSGRALTNGSAGSAVRALFDLTADPVPGKSVPTSALQLRSLRLALKTWDVSTIVVNDFGPLPLATAAVFTATTMTAPEVTQGAWVWNLSRAQRDAPFSSGDASYALRQCLGHLEGVGSTSTAGDGGSSRLPAQIACVVDHLHRPAG